MFKKLTLLLTIIFIMSTNIVSVYAESEGVDTSLHNEVPSYAESNDGNYVDLAESNGEQARTIERYIYRKKM